LRDIFRHTTDQQFLRLRIGIGHPGHRDAVTAYVLSRPSAEQERLMHRSIGDAMEVLPLVLRGELAAAMKALHTVNDDGV
jgi:PTH1 family peptidyl-tRNA hydrolase